MMSAPGPLRTTPTPPSPSPAEPSGPNGGARDADTPSPPGGTGACVSDDINPASTPSARTGVSALESASRSLAFSSQMAAHSEPPIPSWGGALCNGPVAPEADTAEGGIGGGWVLGEAPYVTVRRGEAQLAMLPRRAERGTPPAALSCAFVDDRPARVSCCSCNSSWTSRRALRAAPSSALAASLADVSSCISSFRTSATEGEAVSVWGR